MAYKRVFSITFFSILLPLTFILLISRGNEKKSTSIYTTEINENILCQNPEKEFGIITDSFNIESGRIRWNQNIANILNQYTLGEHSTHEVVTEIDKVFDVTRFKAGKRYNLYFLNNDTTEKLSYIVYEHSPTEYIKIKLKGKLDVQKVEKPVTIKKRTSTGKIEGSLWKTLRENNINPSLAIELSEIYAWNINFFRLNKGDEFKVVYNEKYVDSTAIGIDDIQTASFKHEGDTFYAIPFEQDSTKSFFDLEGNSLRREFLKAPLRFSRISSGYSMSRMHPVLKYRRPHRGVDYAAPSGTPIQAIGDGKVIDKGYSKGAGYFLKIQHNSVYTTGYNHLSGYGKGIKKGKKVEQGEVIGYVGSTGYSTGPHLDFRFWKNGNPVNPLKVEAPPVEPIKEDNIKAFEQRKKECLEELSNLDS
ncbi:MAG: peptidoglycan DD-metalloendopeptidase family protein [Bacteroidota bacterium]